MATKRAKKKTAKKRTAPTRKVAPKKKAKRSIGCLATLLFVLVIAIALITATYYFGSFELRSKMTQLAVQSTNSLRTHPSTPSPVATLLDTLYDSIPGSEGMIVEGGELGRESSHFVAGLPQSRFPIRVLKQSSYTNLYSERAKQAACIAIYFDGSSNAQSKASTEIITDHRVPKLTASQMRMGSWAPQPIAPAKSLAKAYGTSAIEETQLVSNHAPMTEIFANGPWKRAIHQFSQRYPARFGEVWLYMGPVHRPDSSKLSSGIAIPDAFYIIAFDITDAGGLRALSLLIPTEAESENLNDYLSSIEQIEKLTGLQFLPELDYSIRDSLGAFMSPTVW